jgi:hypothetical protein
MDFYKKTKQLGKKNQEKTNGSFMKIDGFFRVLKYP